MKQDVLLVLGNKKNAIVYGTSLFKNKVKFENIPKNNCLLIFISVNFSHLDFFPSEHDTHWFD